MQKSPLMMRTSRRVRQPELSPEPPAGAPWIARAQAQLASWLGRSRVRIVGGGLACGALFGAGVLAGEARLAHATAVVPRVPDALGNADVATADLAKKREKLGLTFIGTLRMPADRTGSEPDAANPAAAAQAPVLAAVPVASAPAATPTRVADTLDVDRGAKPLSPAAVQAALGGAPAQPAFPESTGSAFAVQVAALPAAEGATALRNKLIGQGHQARIVQHTRADGRMLYRVRLHGYDSRESAEAALVAFEKASPLKGLVIDQSR